jgi:hypothetical protein
METRAASPSRATWADGDDAPIAQPTGGDRADPPQPLDRQRMEKGQLAVGRHDQ